MKSFLNKDNQQNPVNHSRPPSPFDNMMFPAPRHTYQEGRSQSNGLINSILKGRGKSNTDNSTKQLIGPDQNARNAHPFVNQIGSQGIESTNSSFSSKITGALDNIQTVLNAVDKSIPLVQQYGPMVEVIINLIFHYLARLRKIAAIK